MYAQGAWCGEICLNFVLPSVLLKAQAWAADDENHNAMLVRNLSKLDEAKATWSAFNAKAKNLAVVVAEAEDRAIEAETKAKVAEFAALHAKAELVPMSDASRTLIALNDAKVAEVDGCVRVLVARVQQLHAQLPILRAQTRVAEAQARLALAKMAQLKSYAVIDIELMDAQAQLNAAQHHLRSVSLDEEQCAASKALHDAQNAHAALVTAVMIARVAHDAAGAVRIECAPDGNSPSRVVRSPSGRAR
jgi:hypothetical protein